MVGLKSPLEVRGRVLINEGASMQLAVNLTAYQRDTGLPLTRSAHPQDVEEFWMVVSSFGFAARNSGPTLAPEGLELLLCELKMTAGADSLNVYHAEPLRYETAIPSNCLSHGACLFDPKSRLGACGAWASKPCMQGAALSAMGLADLVIQHASSSTGWPVHVTTCAQKLTLASSWSIVPISGRMDCVSWLLPGIPNLSEGRKHRLKMDALCAEHLGSASNTVKQLLQRIQICFTVSNQVAPSEPAEEPSSSLSLSCGHAIASSAPTHGVGRGLSPNATQAELSRRPIIPSNSRVTLREDAGGKSYIVTDTLGQISEQHQASTPLRPDHRELIAVRFQCGPLGMAFDGSHVVGLHPRGQGARQGIGIGWKVVLVDGVPVNDDVDSPSLPAALAQSKRENRDVFIEFLPSMPTPSFRTQRRELSCII